MYKNISGKEFKSAMEANPNALVIDVRTEMEFRSGHIPNALHIDLFSPDLQQKVAELDPGKEILVYCRSGARSAHACSMMGHMGFQNLSNLYGGLFDWHGELVTLA
jgi:rhodanese-related sulfurtransferase